MTVFHHYSKNDGFQLLLKFSFLTRNKLVSHGALNYPIYFMGLFFLGGVNCELRCFSTHETMAGRCTMK